VLAGDGIKGKVEFNGISHGGPQRTGRHAGRLGARENGSGFYIGDAHSACKQGEQRERPATAAAGRRAGSAGSTGYARVRVRHGARADSHGARAVCGLGARTSVCAAASGRSAWEGGPVVRRVRRDACAARDVAARHRPARTYFTVPLFGRANLQNFE
jgi:hypothetical protein